VSSCSADPKGSRVHRVLMTGTENAGPREKPDA
jgi:hypothetical protein